MQKGVLLKVGDLRLWLTGKGSVDVEVLPNGNAIITIYAEDLTTAAKTTTTNGKATTTAESENGKATTTTTTEKKSEAKEEKKTEATTNGNHKESENGKAATTTNGNGKPQEAKEEKKPEATTNGKATTTTESETTTTTTTNKSGNHNHNGNGNGKPERAANGEEKATEKQLRTIYAICRKNGIDWHPIIQRMFGKKSSKELTKKEASELIDYLETLEAFRDF